MTTTPAKGAPTRKLAVIGGGAAGFFAAITAAEHAAGAEVTLYESGRHYLRKVKISGGGRCNVTHACFDPRDLAAHYPRGSRELRAAFHRWQPRDTFAWFEERGVALKTEDDGRVFPTTDNSQTIIDCLMTAARAAGVRLCQGAGLTGLTVEPNGAFRLALSDGTVAHADEVCVATGSLQASSAVLRTLESLGHTIEPLAPSLFAFNVSDHRTRGLAGLSVERARVRALPDGDPQEGPLLITHRGFSGPAVLKLSAWEARALQRRGYRFEISIDWLASVSEGRLRERFAALRQTSGAATVAGRPIEEIPRRLWRRLVEGAYIDVAQRWGELPKERELALIEQLKGGRYSVAGKTTNKDEFVTCGGVCLRQVDFRTMESRVVPGLYFAGECLDIDGITGGFNFQAAWTGGRIAGEAMALAGERRAAAKGGVGGP